MTSIFDRIIKWAMGRTLFAKFLHFLYKTFEDKT